MDVSMERLTLEAAFIAAIAPVLVATESAIGFSYLFADHPAVVARRPP